MADLSGKVIIVTGAVGNLGQAVTRRLSALGGCLVLVDRSGDRLQKAYADLMAPERHWFASGVDMTDTAAVAAVVKDARERFGRIDVLVNTVGGFRGGKPVHETDATEFDYMFDINVRTLLNACRAVVPYMVAAKAGRIVNVTSRAAFAGSAKYAAYSAAKTVVLRLTESMAAELKAFGINVNCIVPGTIDTPQNRAAMPDADFATWVSPDDLAGVIAFLLSDDARSITGSALPVYGRS